MIDDSHFKNTLKGMAHGCSDGFIAHEFKVDPSKIAYNIYVDRDMFPYPQGSEVVVRDEYPQEWAKRTFVCKSDGGFFVISASNEHTVLYVECHPLATHGHLLATTYPADTPKCWKCGKAAPDGIEMVGGAGLERYCDECFNNRDKPTATTADGVTVKEGDTVWHPDFGKCKVVMHGYYKDIVGMPENESCRTIPFAKDCYSRPCARTADGVVNMVGDNVWHPVTGICTFDLEQYDDGSSSVRGYAKRTATVLTGILPKECYPIGSRIMTPAELAAITAERDSLRAELDALKAKQEPTAHPGKFQPFQRVLVRDDNDCWRTDIFSHIDGIFYECAGGSWGCCISYDGNEHLLGTSDSPK